MGLLSRFSQKALEYQAMRKLIEHHGTLVGALQPTLSPKNNKFDVFHVFSPTAIYLDRTGTLQYAHNESGPDIATSTCYVFCSDEDTKR
jgi:hypothetical protein